MSWLNSGKKLKKKGNAISEIKNKLQAVQGGIYWSENLKRNTEERQKTKKTTKIIKTMSNRPLLVELLKGVLRVLNARSNRSKEISEH